jgi:hypothetical protein
VRTQRDETPWRDRILPTTIRDEIIGALASRPAQFRSPNILGFVDLLRDGAGR